MIETIDKFHHPEKYTSKEDKPQTLFEYIACFIEQAPQRKDRSTGRVLTTGATSGVEGKDEWPIKERDSSSQAGLTTGLHRELHLLGRAQPTAYNKPVGLHHSRLRRRSRHRSYETIPDLSALYRSRVIILFGYWLVRRCSPRRPGKSFYRTLAGSGNLFPGARAHSRQELQGCDPSAVCEL